MNALSLPASVTACFEKRGLLTAAATVAVALSGGADSVFLLYCLTALRDRYGIDVRALHVHHGIRAAEADRDERFCLDLCDRLGVPLTVRHVDIPALSAARKTGVEETARQERYRIFDEYLADHPDAWIATAHNATDNAETVLFRLLRGTGVKGLCGIPESRGRILRPLLDLTGDQIRSELDTCGVSYVRDSSNTDTAYARNLLRHEVFPVLEKINPRASEHILHTSRSLRHDDEYLDQQATEWIRLRRITDRCPISDLRSLHPSLRYRVACLMHRAAGGKKAPEGIHIRELEHALASRSSHFDLLWPDGIHVRRVRSEIEFSSDRSGRLSDTPGEQVVGIGRTPLVGRSAEINITTEPDYLARFPSTPSLPAFRAVLGTVDSDARFLVRSPEPGDAYRFAGMTRKLKKLLAQPRLSAVPRDLVPVLCDRSGILWLPGYSVRDDQTGPGDEHTASAAERSLTTAKNERYYVYYRYLGGENG